MGMVGVIGTQDGIVDTYTDIGEGASLRTNVDEECAASMIDLHGQAAWDLAIKQTAEIEASGGAQESRKLSEEEIATAVTTKVQNAPVVGTGIATLVIILTLILTTARGVMPSGDIKPIAIGLVGTDLMLMVDILSLSLLLSSTATFVLLAVPAAIVLYGCRIGVQRLAKNELIRVVFPPLVLIVAVLGSILGRITNPTQPRLRLLGQLAQSCWQLIANFKTKVATAR